MNAREVGRLCTLRASVLRAAVVQAAGKMFMCVCGCTWWVAMALRCVGGAECVWGGEARVWGAAGAFVGRVESVEAAALMEIVVVRTFAVTGGFRWLDRVRRSRLFAVVVKASAGAGSLGRSRWGREGGGAGARGGRRAGRHGGGGLKTIHTLLPPEPPTIFEIT